MTLLGRAVPAPASLLIAFLAGCGSDQPAGPPTPTSLTLVSGGDQSGPVGGTLQPITVLVRSQQGPLAGITVGFAVDAGGGSVSRSTAQSDVGGNATVTWSLGGEVGEQRLRVTAGGLPPLIVRATALIGPAAFLTPVAGNSQFAVVGTAVAIRPRVRVSDAFGNPRSGLEVVFAVTEGAGTISDPVKTSNAAGEAELGSWTLGPMAGANRIRATSGDLTADLVAFGTPAVVTSFTGDNQVANSGTLAPVQPAVRAFDGQGQPLANVAVTWTVESGGGRLLGPSQNTDANGVAQIGWILGLLPGPNTLKAQVGGVPSVLFSATGVAAEPAAAVAAGGDGLVGFFGNFVAGAPTVRVTDDQGNPVAGQSVGFSVVSGGGSVAGASATTDFDGRATLGSWRLGPTEAVQQVRAQAAGLPPITFSAAAEAPPPAAFHIAVRFTSTPTPTQEAAFTSAARRWERIILGDLPDELVEWPAGSCVPVALNETIDDLLIFAELVDIDGVGNILGSAGPCLIRDDTFLTVVGRMRFDTADLGQLEAQGRLEEVILHEMGHVLGFGTLWSLRELIQGAGGGDPFFTGSATRSAFTAMTAPQVFPGNTVPVEGTGGPGTRDSHWRETVFDTELMTGFLDQGVANPLSVVTSTTFRDLGYVVDDVQSDLYTLPAFLQRLGAPQIRLIEVPLPGPIYSISRTGQIRRIFFR